MSLITLNLYGAIPSLKNSKQIRKRRDTGRRFITSSDDHKAWVERAGYEIRTQANVYKDLPIQKCDFVALIIYYGTYRVKDNTNVADSVHDLLTHNGVIKDDAWVITNSTLQLPIYRKNAPGCQIIIQPSSQRIPKSPKQILEFLMS